MSFGAMLRTIFLVQLFAQLLGGRSSSDVRVGSLDSDNVPSPAPIYLGNALDVQERFRMNGNIAREMINDDDHVWSSAPTEDTNAPTPSGSSSISASCMSGCAGYSAATWNLDNWCGFYWDAGCYLPDTNYLSISPAGKEEVSDYACVPSCLQGSGCGAAYCRTFSHLSSSCRTGYAHLSFNSTLQDSTHEQCMESFIAATYAAQGWGFSQANLTYYAWTAKFTLIPAKSSVLSSDHASLLALRSATAHVLSGVSLSEVSVISIQDTAVLAPTLQPTFITSFPTPTHPTGAPSGQPTTRPSTDDSVICEEPGQNQWCNNNEDGNVYLGVASTAADCQTRCNAYVGTDFESGCCQWYLGNTESRYEHKSCSLQPNGGSTAWVDGNDYWSARCHGTSAHPSPAPTFSPTTLTGATEAPSPAPSLATPLPSLSPTFAPSLVPTPAPSVAVPILPTVSPTVAAEGVQIILQINSTTQAFGIPFPSKTAAYTLLSTELRQAFASSAFKDSIFLASLSYGANASLLMGGSDLSTELQGYDNPTAAPTAVPSVYDNTPAPTPTLYFVLPNSTSVGVTSDETALVAGSTAGAVVGAGALGAVAYNYASNGLLKVAAEPAAGVEMLVV